MPPVTFSGNASSPADNADAEVFTTTVDDGDDDGRGLSADDTAEGVSSSCIGRRAATMRCMRCISLALCGYATAPHGAMRRDRIRTRARASQAEACAMAMVLR